MASKGKKINAARALDDALNDQRGQLFRAMGIVGLASATLHHAASPIDGSISQNDACNLWTALDGAHEILNDVAAKLENSETLTAKEAANG